MSERNARERPGGGRIEAPAAGLAVARDRGLLRLRRLTRAAVVGATALLGVFAFVAAKALPGHKLHASTPRTVTSSSGATSQSASPSDAAPALAPPPALPAQSQQAPVVVSGGS